MLPQRTLMNCGIIRTPLHLRAWALRRPQSSIPLLIPSPDRAIDRRGLAGDRRSALATGATSGWKPRRFGCWIHDHDWSVDEIATALVGKRIAAVIDLARRVAVEEPLELKRLQNLLYGFRALRRIVESSLPEPLLDLAVKCPRLFRLGEEVLDVEDLLLELRERYGLSCSLCHRQVT